MASGFVVANRPSSSIRLAPPRSPSGAPSSAGWKMNITVPGNSAAHAGEHLGRAEQDRRVAVVAAGVHHADFLAAILGRRRGLERQVDLLRHRQCVHVGAQRDRRARACRPSACRPRRCARCPCALRCPCLRNCFGDDLRRADFAVAEFRVLVEIPAPGDHLRHHRGGGGVERGIGDGWPAPGRRRLRPAATTRGSRDESWS